MLRAVFGTNILVSYLFTHRPTIATLINHHLAYGDIISVTAPALLEELDRVLQYPRLQRYYSETERRRFIALLMALSEIVELPEVIPQICRDSDDDRVIACAVVGGADVILSGDEDLLALEQIGDILTLSAEGFLTYMERRGEEDKEK